jgi:hypothetical protein
MKERPILFSAPMVRALAAGAKTQTRRLWKMPSGCGWYEELGGEREGWFVDHGQPWWLHASECRCPFGMIGDRLWVREAWRAPASCDHIPPRSISDSEAVRFMADETVGADPGFGKGRPGMFMPRWASRITLRVTGVRVERLQDISEEDARAEGAPELLSVDGGYVEHAMGCHRDGFAHLWASINGPDSWDANPWVWVVEFRRVDAGQQQG